MNVKKIMIAAGVAVLSFTTFGVQQASAHSYTYWLHPHWVTVTKTTTIAKNKNTNPLYKSYMVKEYKVYPGHHLKVHHAASYDWVVESGKFNTNSHYTYAVERGSGTSWFKSGIHNLASKKKAPKKSVPKYKSFYGYRIENLKYDDSANTFYKTGIDKILSEYAPTDISQVIFKYGSHIILTNHEWYYIPDNSNTITVYRYYDDAWHNEETSSDQ